MNARATPFRGSLVSREQVAVYEFSWAAAIFVPLVAIFLQAFVTAKLRWLAVLDLPMMVVIFFAVARRNPVTGCITGAIIGLLQDSLGGPSHPIGMFGITDTIIGYAASSLGVKIDVENPGTRFLITYIFLVVHDAIYFGVGRGLLRQPLVWSWSHVAIAGLANAVVGVFVYHLLDRFKQK
ncbi:MAG TPA: rod shape-determining protein MreD [Candidatus Acidoferrum sp.]|nr:rod shape-determining protein MreD [Candidatus Acidoferrum sp.]HVP52464.1 rod shape-determining protein MreD [Terriglobales bacterium]